MLLFFRHSFAHLLTFCNLYLSYCQLNRIGILGIYQTVCSFWSQNIKGAGPTLHYVQYSKVQRHGVHNQISQCPLCELHSQKLSKALTIVFDLSKVPLPRPAQMCTVKRQDRFQPKIRSSRGGTVVSSKTTADLTKGGYQLSTPDDFQWFSSSEEFKLNNTFNQPLELFNATYLKRLL